MAAKAVACRPGLEISPAPLFSAARGLATVKDFPRGFGGVMRFAKRLEIRLFVYAALRFGNHVINLGRRRDETFILTMLA